MIKLNKNLKDLLRPYWYSYKKALLPLQKLIVKPFSLLPFSSKIIGSPKGFYNSTRDWINAIAPDRNIGASYTEIFPSHKIKRPEPKTIAGNSIHWKFRQRYQHEFPTTFVAEVPEGRVFGENGAIITPDDKLLADVSVQHRQSINNHSLFTYWKLPPVHKIDGTAVVLSTQGSDVYFHWMFDVLPRIELLRRRQINFNKIDKFIFSSYHLPFQMETLDILKIERTKIIQNRTYPHIQADKLIVPSWTSSPGNMPNWVCDFLRKSFLISSSPKKLDSPRRLYISRAKASHRQVSNEAELLQFLEPFGFKSVVLESMSVVEQALLFSGAEVVVGAHGAGLSNLIFCNPETKVIELFSPNYVETHYWSLSDRVKLEYYYSIGKGKNPREYTDPHYIWDNILVNLNSVAEIMKLAGIQ